MTAYTKEGKTTSSKHTSGRKSKLADRDRRVLKRIVARKHKQSLSEITSEMNRHLQDPVSSKAVKRELHAANIYGRVAIRKPLVTPTNAFKRRQWCRDHKCWSPQQWQQVIWSDESSFTLFQTIGRVYVWRTPKEAFNPECLLPTVKHGGGSIMTVFPGERPLFQDDNAPIHTARCVQEWFEEHDDAVDHLAWPPQSPDLNIIEHLWQYLESKIRSRFPPPSGLSELKTAVQEEWLNIPLNIVHDLYASIPRRIKSVLQSKGG
ncbi:Transposable element Tcb1 transposase [Araneus ventricosus]|uniref:Transposable element Tcb1 transposase n=1 Tax=Araneus ventricosus TaxID=182803 RepID=A0A4Y2V3W1_ARAVE|nr:Transposable element Tcb1 transposase [Araneus ventricosus]